MPKGGHIPAESMAEKIARARAEIDRMQDAMPPADVPSLSTMVEKFSQGVTASLEPGAPAPPYLSALRNKIEVERLSRQGVSVKDIARKLGLSVRHVVELRAELGVGRRRRPPIEQSR